VFTISSVSLIKYKYNEHYGYWTFDTDWWGSIYKEGNYYHFIGYEWNNSNRPFNFSVVGNTGYGETDIDTWAGGYKTYSFIARRIK